MKSDILKQIKKELEDLLIPYPNAQVWIEEGHKAVVFNLGLPNLPNAGGVIGLNDYGWFVWYHPNGSPRNEDIDHYKHWDLCIDRLKEMLPTPPRTTIQLSVGVKKLLSAIGQKGETYEDIILRLIKSKTR